MNNINFRGLFDCLSKDMDQRLVFVIMPFDQDLTNIFETIVKPTVESKGLRCEVAADFMTSNTIIGDILEGICKARFLIADVTRYNPKVMYELGVAHALKK